MIEQRKENTDQDKKISNDLELGKTYVFDCITDSIWPVKWRKLHNRNSIHDEENDNADHSVNAGYVIKKSTISFDSLSHQDFGEYVCVSSNLFGKTAAKLVISENGFDIKQLTFLPHQTTNSLRNRKKLLMSKNARMRAKLAAKRKQNHNNNNHHLAGKYKKLKLKNRHKKMFKN